MLIALCALSDQLKYLFNILFSKRNLAIIDQDAGNTHNVVFLSYFFKMMNIVYLSGDVLVFCRNMLRGYYGIRAHRARQRYEHLNICRLADRLPIAL